MLFNILPSVYALPPGWVSYNTRGNIASTVYDLNRPTTVGSTTYYYAANHSGWYKQYTYLPNITVSFRHGFVKNGSAPDYTTFDLTSGILSMYHNYESEMWWIVIYLKYSHDPVGGQDTYELRYRKVEYNRANGTIMEEDNPIISINFPSNVIDQGYIDHKLVVFFTVVEVYNTSGVVENIQLQVNIRDYILGGNYSFDKYFLVNSRAVLSEDDAYKFVIDNYGWWVWIGTGYVYTTPSSEYMDAYATNVDTQGLDYLEERIILDYMFDQDRAVFKRKVRVHRSDVVVNINTIVPVIVAVAVAFAFKQYGFRNEAPYIGMVLGAALSFLFGLVGMAAAFLLGIVGVFVYER